MWFLIRWIVLLFSVAFRMSSAYRILCVTSAIGSKSHSIYLNAIAAQLVARGHQVVHLSSGNFNNSDGMQHAEIQLAPHVNLFDMKFDFVFELREGMHNMVRSAYQHPVIAPLLLNATPHRYDAVLLDSTFHDFLLPLFVRMDIPIILVSPSHLLFNEMWTFNIPFPISCFTYFDVPRPLKFLSKTVTFVLNLSAIAIYRHLLVFFQHEQLLKYFPPQSLLEIQQYPFFLFTNFNPAIEESMPSLPFMAQIGCPHCRPPQQLPPVCTQFDCSFSMYEGRFKNKFPRVNKK